jgi:hypothetical protein
MLSQNAKRGGKITEAGSKASKSTTTTITHRGREDERRLIKSKEQKHLNLPLSIIGQYDRKESKNEESLIYKDEIHNEQFRSKSPKFNTITNYSKSRIASDSNRISQDAYVPLCAKDKIKLLTEIKSSTDKRMDKYSKIFDDIKISIETIRNEFVSLSNNNRYENNNNNNNDIKINNTKNLNNIKVAPPTHAKISTKQKINPQIKLDPEIKNYCYSISPFKKESLVKHKKNKSPIAKEIRRDVTNIYKKMKLKEIHLKANKKKRKNDEDKFYQLKCWKKSFAPGSGIRHIGLEKFTNTNKLIRVKKHFEYSSFDDPANYFSEDEDKLENSKMGDDIHDIHTPQSIQYNNLQNVENKAHIRRYFNSVPEKDYPNKNTNYNNSNNSPQPQPETLYNKKSNELKQSNSNLMSRNKTNAKTSISNAHSTRDIALNNMKYSQSSGEGSNKHSKILKNNLQTILNKHIDTIEIEDELLNENNKSSSILDQSDVKIKIIFNKLFLARV